MRSRWLPAAIVALVLLVAGAVLSSQLGSDGRAEEASQDGAAESGHDDPAANSSGAAPDVTVTPDAPLGDTTAPTAPQPAASGDGSDDDGGTQSGDHELGAESPQVFGEPEHPVSGVEPYVPSRVRLDEPGLPAEVCQGTLPARRVQLPLRFASTKPEGVDHLSWSPDCRRMVFRVGSTLWVANGDGTGDQPFLTAQHGLSAPAWSPDGEWIAFAQNAIVDGDRSSHIYIVRPSALDLAQITSGIVLDQAPAWSPDGTRIAFSRRARTTDGAATGDFDQYLMAVELANGVEQLLTAGGEHESDPSWSPEGEWLAYRADNRLHALRLEDESERTLASNIVGQAASWSPDGSRIATWRNWAEGEATILVLDLATADAPQEHMITVAGLAETTPADTPLLHWNETGDRLIFHSTDKPGSHWAYLVDVPPPDG